jgi:hypothetical protein
MPEVPANIKEFNMIAGLIFAQLYRAFPAAEDIDRETIAKAIGGGDHKLPSGRSVNEMIGYTIGWLNVEGFTRAFGAHPSQRAMLTTRGLTAMNAVPSGLKETLGTELKKATEPGSSLNLGAIGDLIGGIFGGAVKSMAGG